MNRLLPLGALSMVLAGGIACLGPGTLNESEACAADGPELLQLRCLSCHSIRLEGAERASAPLGIDFDTEDDVRWHAARIRAAVLEKGSMPPERPLASCDRATLEGYLVELEDEECEPSCAGRSCGDDGCGKSCGDCERGEGCDADGRCVCEPMCQGLQCGDDGCGGSCGTCGDGQDCEEGRCGRQPESYAADVFPIFAARGCAASGCHGSIRPSEGLDLSTAAAGYAGLVDHPSTQCRTTRLIVNPGDIDGSYLINKLLGTGMCAGARMPKSGPPFSAEELNAVRAWIESGASP